MFLFKNHKGQKILVSSFCPFFIAALASQRFLFSAKALIIAKVDVSLS